MVLYNWVTRRAEILSALFIVHAQCVMYLDDGKSVSVEWMNEWGGHRVRRTSFTIINTLLTHSFKRWFELVYVPLESYFLIAYLITKWELQPFLFSPHFVQMQSCPSSPFFWVDGHESSQLFERWVRKKTHSESNSVRATVLPFGWTFSLSLYTLRC